MLQEISPIMDKISGFAIKNPFQTTLGRSILEHGISMISTIGFEEFTFKKLGIEIGSPEASIYRYFENKHTYLLYITALYWGMIDETCHHIMSSEEPQVQKALSIIDLLCNPPKIMISNITIDGSMMYRIVMSESVKTFMTKHVDKDNSKGAFSTLKSVTQHLSYIISTVNPMCQYPRALASTIIEMSMFQRYFYEHLPSMTDIGKRKSMSDDLKELMIGMMYAGQHQMI
ncbi:MAG: TetR/AcrR family transcriptional regulator [Ignavibacteria bacterium]